MDTAIKKGTKAAKPTSKRVVQKKLRKLQEI